MPHIIQTRKRVELAAPGGAGLSYSCQYVGAWSVDPRSGERVGA